MPKYIWGILILSFIFVMFYINKDFLTPPIDFLIMTLKYKFISESKLKLNMTNVLNHLDNIQGHPYYLPFPIYYINMDKHTDRNTFMYNQLKNINNVGYTRIPGVNGNLINNTSTDTILYNQDQNINSSLTFNTNYKLTKTEIGCTLSHIIAIQTAYRNKDQIAMICEDDCLFATLKITDNLQDIIKKSPEDWEIIQLSCTHSFNEKKISVKPWIAGNGSTAAYLINRKGMEKIVTQCYDIKNKVYNINYISNSQYIKHPNNGISDVYLFTICKTYRTFPGIIVVNNLKLHTTIQSPRDELWQIERSTKNIQNLIDIYTINNKI